MQLCLILPLCSPDDEHLGLIFAIDLPKVFFSIPLAPAHQDQLSFIWEEKEWTFTVLPWGYHTAPDLSWPSSCGSG